MQNQEIHDRLIEIMLKLREIESKQNELCRNTQAIMNRVERAENAITSLPCEAHSTKMLEAVGDRVPWKQFWSIIVIAITIIAGSYGYTRIVDVELKRHETSLSPHFHQINPNMNEDANKKAPN